MPKGRWTTVYTCAAEWVDARHSVNLYQQPGSAERRAELSRTQFNQRPGKLPVDIVHTGLLIAFRKSAAAKTHLSRVVLSALLFYRNDFEPRHFLVNRAPTHIPATSFGRHRPEM